MIHARRSHLMAIMITAMGVAWPGGPGRAEPLSEFEHFQSYPYLDMGYRQAQENNWSKVERLMRHLLEHVPGHSEARELLAQSLMHQSQFAAAEAELLRLDGPEVQTRLMELRLAWIEHDPNITSHVEAWLESLQGAQRERLWVAHSQTLAQQSGEEAALDWLQAIPSRNDDIALRRRRAILAEATNRWGVVQEQLAPLRQSDQLLGEDWRRLALAHIMLDDNRALEALLGESPNHETTEAILSSASDRAIATGKPAQAKNWLLRLRDTASLSSGQQDQLLELAMKTDDTSLVIALGQDMSMGCLAITYWLAEHATALASEYLSRCNPAKDPQRWLVLAQQLDAEALLANTALPPRWEERRIEIVTQLWQHQNQTPQALSWLTQQPQTAAIARRRGQLLQAMEREGDAADLWHRHYQQTGDVTSLDQATYLYLANGERERALKLLETAFIRVADQLPVSVLDRLASLYAQEDVSTIHPYAVELLSNVSGEVHDMLLLRLANDGHCEAVTRHTGNSSRRAAQWRALGTCAMPDRPGAAVVYYQQAVAEGDDNGATPLAFAQLAAGDPASAYHYWRSQPIETMSNAVRLAAARSALGTGQHDVAAHYWSLADHKNADDWQLGAEIARAQHRPQDALQRQRHALQRDPSAERYYAASSLAQDLGMSALSLDWLAQAAELAPDVPRYRADYAFRLSGSDKREQRRKAKRLLEQSIHDYREDFRLAESLALRYAEFGDSAASRHQLRRAIELEQTPLAIEGESARDLAQRRYRQRRMHETLSRRDTFTFSSTWSAAGTDSASTPALGGDQNTQIAQWDHAIGDEPLENGRQLAIYGRAVLDSNRRSHYGQSRGLGIGIRAKPVSQLNLNLYGEVYAESSGHEGLTLGALSEPLESGSRETGDARATSEDIDLLLRASASFFDQGDYRNDWRIDETHWSERQLYLDTAWWLRRGIRHGIARYRQGHAYKLPTQGPQTLMPYAMLQFTTQHTDGWQQDTRAGLGMRFQHWFDADRHNAYRGNLSLRVEYQHALGGALYARDDGWLMGIEVRY
ncbi:NfrA family protein [Litchfieldella xinjiangensis]|uniref:NfrA family protein n=1 Tax=Litchfieldella xinjiangensis TaxID=1166948 RepID=UPI00069472BF|nr:hypothetical protein [Halomonas xinjiangensis]